MANVKAASKSKNTPKKKTVKTKNKSPKQKTSGQKTVEIPIVRFCSFCGKSSETRKRLIAGPNNVFICDECVEVSNAILLDDYKEEWAERLNDIITGKKKFKIENIKDTEMEAKK